MAVESVVKTRRNTALLAEVAKLYIGKDDLVLDATYGRGKWWAEPDAPWLNEDEFRPDSYLFTTNDLDPLSDAEHHHDFRAFPEEWANRFDVVCFDPPYVAKGGRDTSTIKNFDASFGLTDAPSTPAKLWGFIEDGITECARVLAPRGRLLVKCMDYISSGRYQDGYCSVCWSGDDVGLEHVDTFIHHSGTGPQPTKNADGSPRRQVHSRRSHSYLVVFEKPRGPRL